MSLFTAVNGAVKKIIRWPIGHAGVVKELDGIYAGVDGSSRRIFGRYRWQRYAVITNTVEYIERGTVGHHKKEEGDALWLFTDAEIKNGEIVASGEDESFNIYGGDTFPLIDKYGTRYTYGIFSTGVKEYFGMIRFTYPDNTTDITCDYYNLFVATSEEYSQGNFIDEVSSDNENAFPKNGVQDGYWYVKI